MIVNMNLHRPIAKNKDIILKTISTYELLDIDTITRYFLF